MTESPVADWFEADSDVIGKAIVIARPQVPKSIKLALDPDPAKAAEQMKVAAEATVVAEAAAVEAAKAQTERLRQPVLLRLMEKLGADCEIREMVVGNRLEIYGRKAVQ